MEIWKFYTFISVTLEGKLKQGWIRSSGWPLMVHVCVDVNDHVYTRGHWSRILNCYMNEGFILAQTENAIGEFLLTLWDRYSVPRGQHRLTFTSQHCTVLSLYIPDCNSWGSKYPAENILSPIPEIIGLITLELHCNTTLPQTNKTTAKSYRATETSLPQSCGSVWDMSTSNLLIPFWKTNLCK